MIDKESEYIVVGKVGASFGIKGWVKILSYTEEVANILSYNTWYIDKNGVWEEIKLEEGRPHGKGLIVKLKGFNTPESAKVLNGKNIAVLRSQLPDLPSDEFYWSDLKDLTVIDQNGQILGTVSHIMATGSNDVLVVKGKKEFAIPYLPGQVITEVDLEKREIRVNWEPI